MRIGLDGSFLAADSRYTGMGVYTRCLADALASLEREHEILLLGYGPRPVQAPRTLPWHRLPVLPVGRLRPWLSHQLLLPVVARRLGLDVLHIPGVNLRLSQPGVPFLSPCPLVVTMHDAIPLVYYGHAGPPLPRRLQLGYRIATLAVHRADAIITVSETSRRDVLRCLRISPERLHVVYNGVDFGSSSAEGCVGDPLGRLGLATPYLLYAGSFEPRKNLLGAVAGYRLALAARDLPPLVLVVERESGHREAVMRTVAATGIQDRLRFVHSLSDAELVALYRGASLFLYPSHYEGFGFTPLQALACGVPVIASSAGSLPEVLGDAAQFVDSRSADALAQAIVTLMGRPADAAALAARGPAQASRFRWETAARMTLAVYERTAAGAYPAAPPR